MAFWGIEVKPGKPVTHLFDKDRGRLRISQATLGIGSSTTKSLIQCNVGNKSPVMLCTLLPDKTESCHLDLEFEESDEVLFSVLGPRSVYLTGYYVGNCRNSKRDDETESYGEDIANTDAEESNRVSDEDEYDDSFIDDNDPEVHPHSPVSSGGSDEEMPANKKSQDRKRSHRRLKKKYQSIESDDDISSQQNIVTNSGGFIASEDDDKLVISALKSKSLGNNTKLETEEKANKVTVHTGDKKMKDVGTCVNESNGKADVLVMNGEPKSSLVPSSEVGSESVMKPKKKRKERSGEEKILEVDYGNDRNPLKEPEAQQAEAKADNKIQDLVGNRHDQKATTNMEIDYSCNPLLPSVEVGYEDGPKPKRKRKEMGMEGKSVEGNNGVNCANVLEGEQLKQGEVKEDLAVPNEKDQKPANDKNIDICSVQFVDVCQSEEKKIKKKKKSKTLENEGNTGIDVVSVLSKKEENISFINLEDKSSDVMSYQARTLSNGLIIEELETGKPDGKIAAPGRKVKVYYTGKLKENGQIFDSNIDKAPYKFRLGDEEIIEGWNIGLDGMRVGDKRRLTIPPSMGYGSQGGGENIPPNSWLVYDVQLVGVRR